MTVTEVVLQVGVKILLKNKEGKFLLLHRNLTKYPGVKGEWDIPGGRINSGTPLLENLKREVAEETGLLLSGEPKLLAAQDILREGRHIVRLSYIGEAEGKVILDTEENDEYQWCAPLELKKLENLDIFLKEVLDKRLL